MNPASSTIPLSSSAPASRPALRRSQINASLLVTRQILRQAGVALPRWADWTKDDWRATGTETREIRECMLGWDVTDFGSGRFEQLGRTLFTLRNGRTHSPLFGKSYSEKLLIEPEGQRSPMHYHRSKREDIINRLGGNILVALHPVAADGQPGDTPLGVQVDGISRTVPAGEPIRLAPGESLCIPPHTYHQFWAEEGTGIPLDGKRYTISSEVSSVCDDWNDNVFVDPWAKRFPEIIEDEPGQIYLCHEYPALPGDADGAAIS